MIVLGHQCRHLPIPASAGPVLSSAPRTSWLLHILMVNLIAAASRVSLIHLANLQQRIFFSKVRSLDEHFDWLRLI